MTDNIAGAGTAKIPYLFLTLLQVLDTIFVRERARLERLRDKSWRKLSEGGDCMNPLVLGFCKKESKVVILQRHQLHLDLIKNGLAGLSIIDPVELERRVIFTSDPNKVLEEVNTDQPVFVISGNVICPEECGSNSPISSGLELSIDVKEVNEEAIFFIYSSEPAFGGKVDGIIPKPKETTTHTFLIKMILMMLTYG